MKILITGANGLLGQKLVDLFNEKGIDYLATARGNNRNEAVKSYATMDLQNYPEVQQVVQAYGPQIIIHTAAMTQVDQCEAEKELCWSLNVEVVQNLAALCSEQSIHLVHLSTDFIFDGADGPYCEDDLPNPVNYYGESKLAAEEYLINSKTSHAILRTILVYGVTADMSRSNIILWVKKSLEAGKEIQVVDDQFRTPTLAEDLAQGCLLAAEQKAQGVFHISGKDLLTPYDMAQMTAEYFKLDKKLIKRANSKTFTQPAKRPLKTGFDLKKSRAELGYNPRSFAEGLAVVAAQLKR